MCRPVNDQGSHVLLVSSSNWYIQVLGQISKHVPLFSVLSSRRLLLHAVRPVAAVADTKPAVHTAALSGLNESGGRRSGKAETEAKAAPKVEEKTWSGVILDLILKRSRLFFLDDIGFQTPSSHFFSLISPRRRPTWPWTRPITASTAATWSTSAPSLGSATTSTSFPPSSRRRMLMQKCEILETVALIYPRAPMYVSSRSTPIKDYLTTGKVVQL